MKYEKLLFTLHAWSEPCAEVDEAREHATIMAKSTKQKLAVDGTAKLAARSKASDKHEKPDLNIEEATVASPRETRHRTGYFNDFEADEDLDAEPSSKAPDASAKSKKKAKSASTGDVSKEAKKRKGKAAPATDAANDNEDVEEVEKPAKVKKGNTAKKAADPESSVTPAERDASAAKKAAKKAANKGKSTKADKAKVNAEEDEEDETVADRVAADTAKATKGKKTKPATKEVVVGPSGDTAEVEDTSAAQAATETKPKKTKAATKKKTDKVRIDTGDNEEETGAEKIAADTVKWTKGKKGKPTKKDVAVEPSGDTAEADDESTAREATEPKATKAKAAPKDKAEMEPKPKKAAKQKEGGEGSKAKAVPSKDATKDEPTDTKSKSKKAKKDAKQAGSEAGPAVEPDLAMDQGPFEALLDSGKDKAEEDAKASKGKKTAEKPKKAEKPKVDKPEKSAPAKPKVTSKKSASPVESAAGPKSKKRKASATADPETVKEDLPDPLAEEASAPKKQKKESKSTRSRKSLGESLGEAVSTGVEAVAQGANTIVQSIGGLANDAQNMLTDNTPEVASTLGEGKETAATAAKKAKGKGKAAADAAMAPIQPAQEEDHSNSGVEDDSDSEPDDQTAALLKGLEPSDDDGPAEEVGEGFEEGQPLPSMPNEKDTKKKLKALKKPTSSTEPGVVYLGRIPHGFYEHEMRAYFTQFGHITRLRLSRNRKTGKSKHYAFIEFENEGVAKIVAATMDTYLMFGHILRCKLVPKEDVHESMWKGANKRFKTVPRNKMEGRKLAMPVGKTHWEGRVEREAEKRREKAEKAMTIGYEFVAPALKGVDEVKNAVGDGGQVVEEEQEKSLVTAGDGEAEGAVVVSEEVKSRKVRKGGKVGVEEVGKKVVRKTKRGLEDSAEAGEGDVKKARKGKKGAA